MRSQWRIWFCKKMCMAIPARVISLTGERAVIQTDAHSIKVARVLFPELDVGDWVLVNAGQIVSRLTPEEAEATRELLRELQTFSNESG